MPVILWWGVSALVAGAGLKLAGDGLEDATDGSTKLLLAGAALGLVYLYGKKKRAW